MTSSSVRPLGLRPGCDSPRLYDEVVRVLRTKRYSEKTLESYVGWIRRYLAFHAGRHPMELGVDDVNAFVSDLATRGKVAASTQNLALSAVLFLYKQVLGTPLDRIEGIVRTTKPKKAPVVLSRGEVAAILSQMSGAPKLVAMLQYGTGMRVSEALSLRMKDLDFGRGEILVRSGKGDRDRVTMLPRSMEDALRAHLLVVRDQHSADLARGLGRAPMPGALAKKFPNADREWVWQWVFPATSHYVDRETGIRHRYHLHESVVQKAVRVAVQAAGLEKRATTHTFRHSFATHLLHDGYDVRTVQELLGHRSVKTTQIYLHVLNRGGHGVFSPLDRMDGAASYADRERLKKDR